MKKIKSLFKRDFSAKGNPLTKEVEESAAWVIAGEGIATRKWDGTCCAIKDGEIYKRYDLKKGRIRPDGFFPAGVPDDVTGHWPGWIKCDRENPCDKWHFEAFDKQEYEDGTYELIGEKVNGNKEQAKGHFLIKHGIDVIEDAPTGFDELKEWFKGIDLEGIVWHNPDGRMIKIKGSDFGIKRFYTKKGNKLLHARSQ